MDEDETNAFVANQRLGLGHDRRLILRVFFFCQTRLMLQPAHHFLQRRRGILPGRMIRQRPVGLAVAHPPITVVKCSREDTAIGVVPTYDSRGPTETLGIGENRLPGIEGLPVVATVQFKQGLSIQLAADVFDRLAQKKCRNRPLGVIPRRLEIGEDNALAFELIKGGHREPGESMLESLIVRELIEEQPHDPRTIRW